MNGELFFEGKKYISSNRAAKINGYASDYIGQLCRGGKLECRMVGRSWYVDSESLVAHKNYNANLRSDRKKKKSNLNPVFLLERDEQFGEPKLENKKGFEDGATYIPIRFERDSGPILPTIGDQKIKRPVFVSVEDSFGEALRPGQKKAKYKKTQFWNATRFAKGAYFTAVILTAFASANFLAKINPQTQTVYREIAVETKSVFSEALNRTNNVQEKFLTSSVKSSFDELSVSFYSTIRNFIRGARLRILVLLSGKTVAIDGSGGSQTQPSGPGLVVVPQNEDEPKSVTIAKIKDSFSDEVLVQPDEDGASGVITPVFKKTKGDDFLYVLVPLKK